MTELVPPKKTRKKRESKLKTDQETEWRKKLDQGKKPPLAYAMDQVYKLNDRVEHQSFGIGLVIDLISPDKMNIFFGDGVKLMKCGAKPAPVPTTAPAGRNRVKVNSSSAATLNSRVRLWSPST